MRNWHLIEKEPLLSENYKKPPLVSYKRGRSLKDIHRESQTMKRIFKTRAGESCRPVNPILHQIRVKMQLACFFNVLEWWLLIERNQRQWPHSRVRLAFAFHLARQPLYCNSIAPSGSSSWAFVDSTFFGYLLLVIVPRLFPFRHVARRNVARAIDWSEKKRTRNASLRERNSGLWRCGARDFFFSPN